MEEGLVKMTPDREKARSMLKMAATTMEMLGQIDIARFPSNATKEYYDMIRELASVVLLLDGYKTVGEGTHKRLVEYLQANYTDITGDEIALIDNLRIKRNKIAYDGFFVKEDYIARKLPGIKAIIAKLDKIIGGKLFG